MDRVPGLAEADVPALAARDVPALAARAGTSPEWRIEVTRRGKYWQWRKGRDKDRQSRYGGKFELLSNERKAEYHDNKAKRQTQRAATFDARR
jgi:hypothetical protein